MRERYYVGDQIHKHTIQTGLPMTSLAKSAGIPYKTFASYAKNSYRASIERIHAIASALSMTVDEFLGPDPQSMTRKGYERSGVSCGIERVLEIIGPDYIESSPVVYESRDRNYPTHDGAGRWIQ